MTLKVYQPTEKLKHFLVNSHILRLFMGIPREEKKPDRTLVFFLRKAI